ncbi:adenylosuccinate synthetase [Hamadaea tsunoensis]|uniref:adenylosuccinate synthetase n=1 Tax=Hamadaea tsunoensis TaxID=53368 RepID=UPI0004186DB0|nr:adenylosuccinate synthetase [Hamadaea tsunoensis]
MSVLDDRHVIVVDLGYGDAGKGTVVDFLCAGRPVHAVIRFNGGAQAAHNVVTSDGRHHTFSQFGSGTLRGVPTHLSRFLVVDPFALAVEADHLAAIGVPAVWDLLTIDAGALLATPWHRAANRVRERRRGDDRHGSCGVGVGETMAFALAAPDDAPRVGDCLAPDRLRRRLAAVRDRLTDELGDLGVSAPLDAVLDAYRAFAATVSIVDDSHLGRLLDRGPCVFEGAQGVLLDEWRGWHPYTTWSTTTFDNALSLLDGRGAGRLGVLRGYTVRHGPGPLVTEDPALERPEPHNGFGRWQGAFRSGHFDTPAHAYALEVCGGADGIALTHLDAVDGIRMATGYAVDDTILRRLTPGEPGDLAYQEKMTALLLTAAPVYGGPVSAEAVAAALRTPVVLESFGPTAADKRLA